MSWFHNISKSEFFFKYQPNITISAKYYNISRISKYQQNIKISAKYYNINQISQFQPNFTISAKYRNIRQISLYQPNIKISAKYHNISQISYFGQISQFQPNFTIKAKYQKISQIHNFDQISQFQPNFTISAKFHNPGIAGILEIPGVLGHFAIFSMFGLGSGLSLPFSCVMWPKRPLQIYLMPLQFSFSPQCCGGRHNCVISL